MKKQTLSKSAKLWILVTMVVLLAAVGIYYVASRKNAEQNEEESLTLEIVSEDEQTAESSPEPESESATKDAHQSFREDLYNNSDEVPFEEGTTEEEHVAGVDPTEKESRHEAGVDSTEEEQPPVTVAPTENAGSNAYDVTENGTYTDREHVAQYLKKYGRLPSNFITKNQARSLGWEGGDLYRYANGKSIGGDYFQNREGVLPNGPTYHECDINYHGGEREAERIVWSSTGRIFYTKNHYKGFYEWLGPNHWVFAFGEKD